MTLQTLGTFKKTDTGFEGRIQTLLSNLKLYISLSMSVNGLCSGTRFQNTGRSRCLRL